jgi:hypothetical protein
MYELKKPEQKSNEPSIYCSVEGCGQRWSVHISGQKPMCSKHQWSNTEKKFKASTQPVPTTPVVPGWWNKEQF